LPLQLQEVLIALEIRIGLDADDQIPDRTRERRLDIGPLLSG
jgi:hypothetical protein